MTAPIVVALVVLAIAAARAADLAVRRRRTVERLAPSRSRMAIPLVPWCPSWLTTRLHAADASIDARAALTAWIVTGVPVTALAAVCAGPGLALAAVVAIAVGPALALRLGRGRRHARLEAALPLALESMARTLRTGGSLRQAIPEAADAVDGPLATDLARVGALIDRGASVAAALGEWAEGCASSGARLAAAALVIGSETGGAQARAVDGVAATIRERLASAAEVRAQATQARVSGAVIALSPLAFGALSSATDARTATFLFRTPAGIALLVAGLALDALGALWMDRITRAPA
jgi:tight adherence protein B